MTEQKFDISNDQREALQRLITNCKLAEGCLLQRFAPETARLLREGREHVEEIFSL